MLRLGPDYRLKTRIQAEGVIENGMLEGNLVIEGGGDCFCLPASRGKDALAILRSWSDRLRESNIHAVSGDIVGVDGAFNGPQWGRGWEWNDLPHSYAAPVNALQFNDNTVVLEITPGGEAGTPVSIRTAPLEDYLRIKHSVVTGAPGTRTDLQISHAGPDESVEITGSLPAGTAPVAVSVAVRQPAAYFLSALRSALSSSGIDLDRCGLKQMRSYTPTPGARLLWIHESPPLSELLRPLMKDSLNLQAETLVRVLGLELGGAGTFSKGREIVEEALAGMGIAPGAYTFADGSGLSRLNLQSAETLVRLLQFMHKTPHFHSFYESLPVAAVDGTLAERMKGTVAAGRVRAKTGTMTAVSAIAGYVTTADGELLTFAIGINNYTGSKKPVEALQDKALDLLAGFSRK